MPTNVTMTEKEVVLLQREAFAAGIHECHAARIACVKRHGVTALYALQDNGEAYLLAHAVGPVAAGRYPLPKTSRPRVVYETGMLANAWRYVNGGLQMLPYGAARKEERHWLRWADCRQSSDFAPVPGRVALWADLIANPTEEVEGES